MKQWLLIIDGGATKQHVQLFMLNLVTLNILHPLRALIIKPLVLNQLQQSYKSF